MENIESIVLPDLGDKKPAKGGRPKKENKKVLAEKEILPRINRTVACNYCEAEKIINPDQYQLLFDIHESEDKLKAEFMCKNCEMSMKRNPIKFWFVHSEILHELSNKLKTVFDLYKSSQRVQNDAVAMQTMSIRLLKECQISEPNFEFMIENKLPIGMKLKSIPYVGDIRLNVYEGRKGRIQVLG